MRSEAGIKFLADNKVGLREEQKKGDVKSLLKKWLIAYERAIHLTQDPKIGDRAIKKLKAFFHQKYTPTVETYPKEELIRVQSRASEEAGRGKITDISRETIEQEISKIRDSLDIWIEYFASPDSQFIPVWAKYWALMGVVGMSGKVKIDPATQEISYSKREKNTISGFPELNREALALAVGHIRRIVENGEDLKDVLKKTKFSEIYTFYLNDIRKNGVQAEWGITEGYWIKYNQGNDPDTIKSLVDSIKNHITGWCTRDYGTAEDQLARGDFYVYYTISKKGTPNPRVAIRTDNGSIVEIRGVSADQNLDPVISGTTIIDEKLSEFGDEGEKFKYRSENMRRLTNIYNTLLVNFTYQLTPEEIAFIKSNPEGFGQKQEDPRLTPLKNYINLLEMLNVSFIYEGAVDIIDFTVSQDVVKLYSCLDFIDPMLHKKIIEKTILAKISANIIAWKFEKLKVPDSEHAAIAYRLIEECGQGRAVAENLFKFKGLDHQLVADKLLNSGQGRAVAEYLIKFKGVDHQLVADKLLNSGQVRVLAENYCNFQELDAVEYLNKILDSGNYAEAIINSFTFKSSLVKLMNLLDSKTLERFIDLGCAEKLIYVLNWELITTEMANKLVSEGFAAEVLYKHVNKIEYNENLAIQLILNGRKADFISFKSRFNPPIVLDINFALKIIELGGFDLFNKNFDLFPEIKTDEIATALIKKGDFKSIINNLSFFNKTNYLINTLIDNGYGKEIVSNLLLSRNSIALDIYTANKILDFNGAEVILISKDNIQGLGKNVEILNKIIDQGYGYQVLEIKDLVLTTEIVNKLIENNLGIELLSNEKLNSKIIFDSNFANSLLSNNQERVLAKFINKFNELEIPVAYKMIEKRLGKTVIENSDRFKNFSQNDIADKLLDIEQGELIIAYFNVFNNLKSSIADKIISKGLFNKVINFDIFESLGDLVAIELLDSDRQLELILLLEKKKFKNLSKEVAKRLIQWGGISIQELKNYKSQFINLEEILNPSFLKKALSFFDKTA